ncbi:prepilin-type N-terminal cleavage/methylation domain-containing protein [Oceanobacillus kapialis]|uniref:prepilin-type N-terminal cleavage/methylation domain-containing protein n=1 Tax=Oceanobacillus kapialis TaxID=481353 RepID=UPI003850781C
MLARMKKMFKKEKGFTLVELLAVIAILAIILAIAVPSVGNLISKAKQDTTDANIELVLNAAKLADLSEVKPKANNTYEITELQQAGFLDVNIEDDNFNLSGGVLVATKDGEKTFEYTGSEGTKKTETE